MVLTPLVLEQVQQLLDAGLETPEVADQLDIKPNTLSKAVRAGRLHKSPKKMTLCEGKALEVEDLYLPETAQPAKPSQAGDLLPGDKMEEVQRQAIIQALEGIRWNRTAAAKKIGMSLRSLRYRLEKLGID